MSAGTLDLDITEQGVGQARLAFTQVAAKQAKLWLDAPSFVIQRRPGSALALDIKPVKISDRAARPRFPPLVIAGGGKQAAKIVTARLTARLPQVPDRPLSLSARFDLTRKVGQARFELSALPFDARLQPKALHPALAQLQKVRGRVDFVGSASFTPAGLSASAGQLDLQIDRMTLPGGAVTNLSLPLTLTSLWPLESAAGQRLDLEKFGQGPAVEDLVLRYRLDARQTGDSPLPVVAVEQATMRLLGGRLNLGPSRLDPAADAQNLVLLAEELDLVSVLSLLNQEGVAGNGRLRGRVPLAFRAGQLVIDGVRLEAEGPGVLAFTSGPTEQALIQGGKHINLLLRALQNFHYQDLLLTLDRQPNGQSQLLLALNGSNPDLYAGYPFALNLTLETAAAPLLSAITAGSSLYEEVIRRALKSR